MIHPSTSLLASVMDLVLGTTCAGCEVAGGPLLCEECAVSLAGEPRAVRPTPCPDGFPRTWAVASYVDPIRAVLLAHKERGRLGLARPLGDALGHCLAVAALTPPWQPSNAAPVAVIPVPSRPRTVRERGHDPVLRMARRGTRVARSMGIAARLVPGGLRHRRLVVDQAGLDSQERLRNMHESLSLTGAATQLPDGSLVVVVDDILTTGATLTAARRAVAAAGDLPVRAAVIAATVRRTSLK